MNIYLDIETVPSQREDVRARIKERIYTEAEAAEPPRSITDLKTEETRVKRLTAWRMQRDAKAVEDAEEQWRRTALEGGYGEAVCISWAVDDGPVRSHWRSGLAFSEERALLEAWFEALEPVKRQHSSLPTFCGHNIEFDLRFLHHRSVIHGIQPPIYLPYNAAAWQGRYIDTVYEWCGARGSVKLVELCDMLGIDVEDAIDGSQVWDAFQAGDITAIVEHCESDVERVRQIERMLRWQPKELR